MNLLEKLGDLEWWKAAWAAVMTEPLLPVLLAVVWFGRGAWDKKETRALREQIKAHEARRELAEDKAKNFSVENERLTKDLTDKAEQLKTQIEKGAAKEALMQTSVAISRTADQFRERDLKVLEFGRLLKEAWDPDAATKAPRFFSGSSHVDIGDPKRQ